MKANELMIGDWVKSRTQMIVKIMGLSCDAPCEYEPIPLTTEILEKNGYVKDALCKEYMPLWVSEDSRITLNFNTNWKKWNVHIDDKDFCSIGNMECDFVHEFQHIMRLCGRNDIADNFKI